MHQYFPHLSIRQSDLACVYGITANHDGQIVVDDEVIDIFIHDLEKAIRNKLTPEDAEEEYEEVLEVCSEGDRPAVEEDQDEHYIYRVESFSATYVLDVSSVAETN